MTLGVGMQDALRPEIHRHGIDDMAARIQGFPDDWQFYGKKTAAYRQIGNAFPPPVAYAVGKKICAALFSAAKPNLQRVGIDKRNGKATF